MKKQIFLLILTLTFFVGKVSGQCVSVGSDQTICMDGQTTSLGGALAGGASNPQWDDGGLGGTFTNSTSLSSKWTPPSGYTGTANLTLTAGSGSCSPLSAVVHVTVVAQPVLSQPGDIVLCKSGSTILTTSPTGGTGSFSYQWKYSSTIGGSYSNVANNTPSHISYSGDNTSSLTITGNGSESTGDKFYKCVLTTNTPSGAGCSAITSAVTVTTVSDPTLSQPSDVTICENDQTILTTSPTGGTGTYSYQWKYSTSSGGSYSNIADGTPSGITYSGGTTNSLTVTGNGNVGVSAMYYKCVLTSLTPTGAGCNGTTSAVTVTVNSIPNISLTVGGTGTICSGTGNNITVASSQSGVNYQLRQGITNVGSPIAGTGGTINLPTGNLTTTTTFNILATKTSSGCSAQLTGLATVSVDPVSVGGSASPQEICSGSTPSDIVLSGNTGTVTKWQQSSNAGFSSPTDIPVASTTLPGATIGALTSTTYFRAVVQSGVCSAANSSNVVITVDPVTVGGTVASDQTICSNVLPANLVLSGNTGSVLKWQSASDLAFTTPVDIAIVSNTLTGATIGILSSNTYFRAVVQSGVCSVVNSSSVLITVNPIPSASLTVGGAGTICSGTGTNITVASSESGVNYQLRNNSDNSLIGIAVAGTGASINLPTGNLSSNTTFNILATNAVTLCPVQLAQTALVSVDPVSVGGSISGSVSVCSGTNSSLLTLTGQTGSIIKWQYSTDSWVTPNDIVNSTSNFTATNLSATTEYRAVIQSGVCSPVNSGIATITVNPLPANGLTVGGTTTICSGTGTNITVALSEAGVNYQLRDGVTNIGSFVAGTGGTINLPTGNLAASATFNVLATNATTSCSVQLAGTVTITVDPTPTVNSSSAKVICNNGNVNYTITSATTGTTYTWTASLLITPVGGSVTGFNNCALTCGSLISDVLVNTGTSPGVVRYQISPTGPAGTFCPGPTFNFDVTVNPTPDVTPAPASQTICNGAATNIGLTTSITSATVDYAWTAALTTGTASGFSSGTGTPIVQPLTNSTTSPATVTYTITPKIGSCTGTPVDVVITVNPSGQVNQPLDKVVCNGSNTTTVSFVTTNTGGTTTFSWTNNQPGIGLAASSTGDIPSFTAVNAGVSPVVASIVVTPHFTNNLVTCDGPTKTFTITVNPTGEVDQPANQVVCNGSGTTAVNFTTTNSGGTTTYSWTNNQPGIGIPASNSGNISSFTAINAGTTPVVATIIVTPHFLNGSVTCDGPIRTFTITVNPSAEVDQPVNQVLCNGSGTSVVTFSTVNTGGTTTYSWTNDQPGIGLSASSTGNIASFTAFNAGTSPVVASIVVTPHFTNALVTCDGPTKTFTITVNPTAQVNVPSNQALCNGGTTTTVNFGTINTGGTTTYNWTNNTTSIGLAASGTGNIGAFSAINSGNAPVTATITVYPTYTNSVSCSGPSETFTITVNPTPSLTGASQVVTVCDGSTATINLLGLLPNVTSTVAFNINGVPQTPVTGVASNGSGAASFTTPVLVAANNGQYLRVTGVTTTSTSPGCTMTFTSDVALSVNALTVGGVVTADQSICSGTSPADLNLGGYTGNIVRWEKSLNSGFSSPAPISVTSSTLTGATIGNLTTDTWFRAVVQNGVCSLTNSSSVMMTVNPLPSPTITGPAPVNVTSSGNVYSTESGKTSYTWNVSGAGNTITAGSGTNAVTVTWNTPGDQTVTVNYLDANLCAAASPASKPVHVNAKPVISNITILGDPRSNITLNTFYTYSDAETDLEGTSTFQWYKGTDALGTGSTTIASATARTYKLKDADTTYYIGFSAVPVAQSGATPGVLATSVVWVGPVTNAAPTVGSVGISGSKNVTGVLSGNYTYSDLENDLESGTLFQWYSSNSLAGTYTPIAGETFNNHVIANNEQGLYFKFYITPKAATGKTTGYQIQSAGYGPANSQPYATNVAISGSATIGSTLNGSYIYNDVDGDVQGTSTFRWLRTNISGTTVISGVTGLSYTLTSADEGYTISFEVTPVASTGIPGSGTPVTVSTSGPVLDPSVSVPVADQVCISGIRKTGEILTGKYNYTFYKSEGTSNYRWLLNNVPISGATGTQYTLTQSDIDGGKDILFEVTPKSSNFIPKVGLAVQSNPLARIVLAQTNYSLADTAFVLVPNVSGGVFSGVGVSNGYFSPWNSDTASKPPHTVKYDLTITNSITTCSERATVDISVVAVNAFFVGLPGNYCYDAKPDTIFVQNVPTYATNRTYKSTNPASIIKILHSDTIIIDPHMKRPGIFRDTLSYSYKFNGSFYPITQSYTTDSVGVALINNLSNGQVFCNNDAPFTMYPSILGPGGVFTGPVTGSTLDPSKGLGNTVVNFTYTNSKTGCFSAINVPIKINPAPKVTYVPKAVCIASNTDIINFSNHTTSSDSIATWEWRFFDAGGSAGSALKEPGYLFKNGGQHVVSLTATTINNCVVKKDSTIDIGVKPIVDFRWEKECYLANDSIMFIDLTTSSSTITSKKWNFFDSKPLLKGDTVRYPKTVPGYLSVRLTIKTPYANCADSIFKQVYIRPSISLATDDYFQNFESGNGGWVKDYVKNNTWSFGTPARKTINHAASGVNAWVTNFAKDSLRSESIISPCFDFSNIQRPMISVKLWKAFDRNRDGAALQYKIGDKGTWQYVGTLDDGITWYNSPLINGKPGGDKLGWTAGTNLAVPHDTTWIESRHTLDELAGQKQFVTFRIAYGSDGTATGNDGIAFDDIKIGRRTRSVMLEHFTNNSSSTSTAPTATVSDLSIRRTNDVINIQYHTNFPGSDSYYNDNPGDASARFLFYGLSRAPYTILDGGTKFNSDRTLNYANIYDYLVADLDSNDLTRRSLTDPAFLIAINDTLVGGVVKVKGQITALKAINAENVTLYLAVTEKQNTLSGKIYYNVFRKFIPDAAGTSLNTTWAKNDTYTLPEKTWVMQKIANTSDIEIIAFLQNNVTKEIYQAKSGIQHNTIVGIDNLFANNGRGFSIYPNPSVQKLTIAFEDILQSETEIMIYDFKGTIVRTYKIGNGESEYTIENVGLQSGIYLVRVKSGGIDWGFRKLLISKD